MDIGTLYDLQGREVWKKSDLAHLPSDSTVNCFEALSPDTAKSFMLRLEAVSMLNGELLSTNTYFLWGEEKMTNMPKTLATLSAELSMNPDDENTIILTNTSDTPALMIRLNLCGNDGEQILPVEYSDNYFHLLPGERKEVSVKWAENDTRGTRPLLKISAFNVKEFPVSL